jgi:large subunit ribosomal protein L17e
LLSLDKILEKSPMTYYFSKKGNYIKNLTIEHVQVDRAAKGRRRTYRAHGRIGPYLSCQAHVQMFAT